ncbi:MAG: penicillin-binding protein activator, partial [Robiginitomaculum sp.]|nr:penicillin-binding protein activator [Robiginitomaculum sp.]
IAACATTTPPQGQGQTYPPIAGQYPNGQVPPPIQNPNKDTPKDTTQPNATRNAGSGLTPAFMNGKNLKRVAIILPFSAKSARLRAEAESMLHAAELALFTRDEDDVLLMTFDSAGTSNGARIAAQTAVKQGADIILGPILAASVKASGDIALRADTPMIAFSTDTSVAKPGVYLLSFPPEAEVKRVTEFVRQSGARKFAFLGPDSRYGKRVLDAYNDSVTNLGGEITGVEIYHGNDITVMQDPARRLAQFYTQTHLANEEKLANGQPVEEAAFHVVMLPEGGTALRSLAPLLPFFEENINASSVQFVGTGLWNRGEVVREPALRGGIFAGPDQAEQQVFAANYDAVFGEEPSRLASLAYDGLNIAAFAASGDPKKRTARLTDDAGFFGADGLVRFNTNGRPERGLAIYQIKNGRFVIIDPAPKSTSGTS